MSSIFFLSLMLSFVISNSLYAAYLLDVKVMHLENQLKAAINENLLLKQELSSRSIPLPFEPVEIVDPTFLTWLQSCQDSSGFGMGLFLLSMCICSFSRRSELGIDNNLSSIVDTVPQKVQFLQTENSIFNLDLVISTFLNTYREVDVLLSENMIYLISLAYPILEYFSFIFIILISLTIYVELVGCTRNNSK